MSWVKCRGFEISQFLIYERICQDILVDKISTIVVTLDLLFSYNILLRHLVLKEGRKEIILRAAVALGAFYEL